MPHDPYNLARFLSAQSPVYGQVQIELGSGRKQSHWMWFIFPQLAGLGHSETSRHFAIRSVEEAYAYCNHPLLGRRLRECTASVLAVSTSRASDVFGNPDDLKFRSSMTLFHLLRADCPLFHDALQRFYDGTLDQSTVQLLKGHTDLSSP